ncbi:HPr family phosphocarrier protein [Sansalvadorimonas sp. 2012CJ34-2]|uniref:Phosphocarrier protein HPr n=1 Tax=Parendozoicomonas callyspongiae TaxID=2942213 RepID=A0ABT0PC25_9GAMM|nr:HPr family phosphocarrier protein [Sansalvadorimonas sp. 2012CJ34-2]MCL6268932.1 HPr family phosphocarrier protein [Sansalvadorimonas sp. 2012CJ34-2]
MQSVQLNIINENGFHARPGTVFVKACKQFSSKVTVEKNGQTVNAKSLMKLLGLGVVYGDAITLCTEGEDELQALDQLKHVVETLEG